MSAKFLFVFRRQAYSYYLQFTWAFWAQSETVSLCIRVHHLLVVTLLLPLSFLVLPNRNSYIWWSTWFLKITLSQWVQSVYQPHIPGFDHNQNTNLSLYCWKQSVTTIHEPSIIIASDTGHDNYTLLQLQLTHTQVTVIPTRMAAIRRFGCPIFQTAQDLLLPHITVPN